MSTNLSQYIFKSIWILCFVPLVSIQLFKQAMPCLMCSIRAGRPVSISLFATLLFINYVHSILHDCASNAGFKPKTFYWVRCLLWIISWSGISFTTDMSVTCVFFTCGNLELKANNGNYHCVPSTAVSECTQFQRRYFPLFPQRSLFRKPVIDSALIAVGPPGTPIR